MATTNTYLPRILQYPSDPGDIGREPVGNTAEDIRVGDPVIYSNGNTRLELLTAAAEDEDFVGIAGEAYNPDREKVISKMTYYRKCVIRVTVSGLGAQDPGTAMAWGSDGSMALAGTANTAGWLHKAIASGATEADVLIDIARLGKQFGLVSA